eukprot:jgi/Tetstr1/431940/TSEL_002247.t1
MNEYLKQDGRRLPAQEEYLWMSCFGALMSALVVDLDELMPYVPAANQDFTPYLARARKHAEAIDKAVRFRPPFLRRLNEAKRVHDELGHRTLDLLSISSLSAQTLKSYAGGLSPFAEFCHDSENISPLEATTATVVRYVAWIESIVSALFPEYDFRDLMASVVNFMYFARGLTGVFCQVRDVHVDDYNITLQVYREKGRAGRRGPEDLRVLLLPVSEHPCIAHLLHRFIDHVQSVPLAPIALTQTNFWAVTPSEQFKSWTAATIIRYQGGWATNSDVVLDYIDPNVLPSPGAWFFFGHIAPLRHFQVQQDSAAVAFPVSLHDLALPLHVRNIIMARRFLFRDRSLLILLAVLLPQSHGQEGSENEEICLRPELQQSCPRAEGKDTSVREYETRLLGGCGRPSPDGFPTALPPDALDRSLRALGGQRLRRVLHRLASGHPLTVLALGGSVTESYGGCWGAGGASQAEREGKAEAASPWIRATGGREPPSLSVPGATLLAHLSHSQLTTRSHLPPQCAAKRATRAQKRNHPTALHLVETA